MDFQPVWIYHGASCLGPLVELFSGPIIVTVISGFLTMLAEVESEKSIGEVEAREDRTVRQIYAEVDDSVLPGTPIGILYRNQP